MNQYPKLSDLPPLKSDALPCDGVFQIGVANVDVFRVVSGRAALRLALDILDHDMQLFGPGRMTFRIAAHVIIQGRDKNARPCLARLYPLLNDDVLKDAANTYEPSYTLVTAIRAHLIGRIGYADIRRCPRTGLHEVAHLTSADRYGDLRAAGLHRRACEPRLAPEPEPDPYVQHRLKLEQKGVEPSGLPKPVLTVYGPIDHPDYA